MNQILSMLTSETILYISLSGIVLTGMLFTISHIRKSKTSFGFADKLHWGVLIVLLLFFLVKYHEVQYVPIRTLFETLVFLAITISVIYFLFSRLFRIPILGAATMLFMLLVLIYALIKKDSETTTLPAALQSIWFVPHVFIYFIGYAALFLSAALGLLFLLYPSKSIQLFIVSGERNVSINRLMHFMTIVGFIFISAGLIIGAVWAKEAWGDYWAWDPKENWALITLLVYALYFHIKNQKGLSQKTLAQILIVGFAVVAFTYLSMSVLPTAQQSEHVYIEKNMGK